MKQESLDKILDLIIASDINNLDKLELLINLKTLFNDYKENIEILEQHSINKQKRKLGGVI